MLSDADELRETHSDFAQQLWDEQHPAPLPAWIADANLPPLIWRDGSPAPVSEPLLWLLKRHPETRGKPALAQLRQRLDTERAADFLWRLVLEWEQNKAPSAQRWILTSLPLFATNRLAERLGEKILEWLPRRGFRYQKAQQGIELLSQFHTDAAIAQLDWLAGKLRFRRLRQAAEDAVDRIAQVRGLGREELADAVVPSLGLDPKGGVDLDYGPRRFRAHVRPDLALVIQDEAGKSRQSLPRPGKHDDPDRANAAVETFHFLKLGLKQQGVHQSRRLERSMVEGRVWSIERWKELFLDHPFLRLLAPRVLWAEIEDAGRIGRGFRVCEDWTFADECDRPLELSGRPIGIPHPLDLAEPIRRQWRELFVDYRIPFLFDQVDRAVFSITEEDRKAATIERFLGRISRSRWLLEELRRLDWEPGPAGPRAEFDFHYRVFRSAGIVAVLHHSWIFPGTRSAPGGAPVTLGRVYFGRADVGAVDLELSPRHVLPPDKVPPIIFSETIRDLTEIATDSPRRQVDDDRV